MSRRRTRANSRALIDNDVISRARKSVAAGAAVSQHASGRTRVCRLLPMLVRHSNQPMPFRGRVMLGVALRDRRTGSALRAPPMHHSHEPGW